MENVLFSPEQKEAFVRYLMIQQMAGLTLEDVIERIRMEEFVEQDQVG